MEICKCPKCSTNTVKNEAGKEISGSWVHSSTRRKHYTNNVSALETLDELVQALPSTLRCSEVAPAPSYPVLNDERPIPENTKNESECRYVLLFFLTWLNLICGVSQSNCRIARDFILSLIKIFGHLPDNCDLDSQIPKDIRTITKKLDLNPELNKHICCKNCFSIYDPFEAPSSCTFRAAPAAKICGEPIFKKKLTSTPSPFPPTVCSRLKVPAPLKFPSASLVYHTQPFEDWLKWFLNVSNVEESIQAWKQKVQSAPSDKIVDIQQSTAWKSFEIKADRRQASMGLVALTCMNLPTSTRNKLGNIFISGIIPAPKEPDMTTISHVLKPLIDELIILDHGIWIKTPKFPNGRKVSIHLGVLIGDIVASHKIAGFASHSATLFCSWCKCKKDDMDEMIIAKMRNRRQTQMEALRWREAITLTEKNRLLKSYGTRWSELNRLPYWDPVKNVALGIMHSWYEGVLKHHWRVRWGFQQAESDSQSNSGEEENLVESDIASFQATGLEHIRCSLQDIIVPRGVTQVPHNLGDPKHGKFKASEWHALFSIYLPLTLIDYFVKDASKIPTGAKSNSILNFSSLVICTNIVASKSISQADSKRFYESYSLYTESSKAVFGTHKIVPNHHYCLHLPQQLSWWGPLSNVSEFSGERINGILQKMDTNGIIGQIEGTVLRKFCQLQRFNAKKNAHLSESEMVKKKNLPIIEVHPEVYDAMLQELRKNDPSLRSYKEIPHPPDTRVLTPHVKEEQSFQNPTGLYVSKSKQNSLVVYWKGGGVKFGWVTHIYRTNEYGDRVFLVIRSLVDYQVGDGLNTCSSFIQSLKDMELGLVRDEGQYEIVDPSDLDGVCAYRHLAAWTFGYHKPLILIRPIPHDCSPLFTFDPTVILE